MQDTDDRFRIKNHPHRKDKFNITHHRDKHRHHIAIYYETLCPDSVKIFQQQLIPHIEQIHKCADLYLYPLGNANVTYGKNLWHVECQHGPSECHRNRIHACAIYLYKHSLKKYNYDDDKLLLCQYGRLAQLLEFRIAINTFLLKPAHTYVPWIVFNGRHTPFSQELNGNKMVRLVCSHSTSSEVKKVCCPSVPSTRQSVLITRPQSFSTVTPIDSSCCNDQYNWSSGANTWLDHVQNSPSHHSQDDLPLYSTLSTEEHVSIADNIEEKIRMIIKRNKQALKNRYCMKPIKSQMEKTKRCERQGEKFVFHV
ncbi:unnamed protein product [Didymodactylos carnosus]|uniref:Gamma-interferon-inducible lysosomal thiol reductase n=1 Tax=Didymodactylos carnosus TaxID=1234261 RepID=A0A814FRU6_9BILA|nr:unnamed protein product [Didymodactylos carnosus]CAF1213666.1 unnamed protein product [Didymodactylos carnosus]CAF3757251.1 unnamed protein product [Didymodactylos carnosus]CAF4022426.1 unnamed protein product [Didymodactylos carnosus]